MEDPQETLPAETGGDGAVPQKQTADPLTTISVDQLTSRVKKIRRARAEVMEEDVHFGTIPGTGDKPTLLKPGAETLCNLFQLAPDPDVEIVNMEGDHREYIVRGGLRHIPTGNQVGSGVGSCSTKESKYRYRYIEDATDVQVPNEFWRSADEMKDRDFSLLRDELQKEDVPISSDAEASVTKEQGQWLITIERKGENPDLADVYNTCLKMAKKRWLVDVTLTATGASEAFTQDLDDMADLRGTNVGGDRQHKQQTQQPQKVERYGHALLPSQAEKLKKRDDALAERDGDELAAAIKSVESEMEDWPSDHLCSACDTMLDKHRKRVQKHMNDEHGLGEPTEDPNDTAGEATGESRQETQSTASPASNTTPTTDTRDADSPLPATPFPSGFPEASTLQDEGLKTPRDVGEWMGDHDLEDIDGIGEVKADSIRSALEDMRSGEFEGEIPF
jgi:hypothetical protein